jgi:hypothetical protein
VNLEVWQSNSRGLEVCQFSAARLCIFNKSGHNGFLSVETVFGLPENRVRMGFESLFIDFLAPVGWQAVHHQSIRRGLGEEFGVD